MTARTGDGHDHVHQLVRVTDSYFRYQCIDPRCDRKLRILSGVLVQTAQSAPGQPQPIVAILDHDHVTEPFQSYSNPEEYDGLTDCQICVLESLQLDGPAPTARLQVRLPAYNAMSGIPRPQWFTHADVQTAVDQLFDARRIRWNRSVGWEIARG